MTTETIRHGSLPYIHWGPVITGVLCALGIQITLGLFGFAFGFAAEPADSAGLGFLAAAWTLVVPFLASFVGAMVAVRIAKAGERPGALLHGVLVWSIGLVFGALFITSSLASGAMSAGQGVGDRIGAIRNPQVRNQLVEESARKAAAGAGLAGVAAILGLVGAGLGAERGRRALSGDRHGHRRDSGRGRLEDERDLDILSRVVEGPDRTTPTQPH
jgi:hypothetical protein